MYFSLEVSAAIADVVHAVRFGTAAKYWFRAGMVGFLAQGRVIACFKAGPEVKCRLTCAAKMDM